MKRTIVAAFAAALLFTLSVSSCVVRSSDRGSGPMCSKGCRCGNACIECSKMCSK